MKKILALCLVLAMVTSLLTGCLFGASSKKSDEIEEIDLDKDEIVLCMGEAYKVEFDLEPRDADEDDLDWESDDEDIAFVRDGIIYAIREGDCVITVSGGDAEEEIEVRVVTWHDIDSGEYESDANVDPDDYYDDDDRDDDRDDDDDDRRTETVAPQTTAAYAEQPDSYEAGIVIGTYELDEGYYYGDGEEEYLDDSDDGALYIYSDGTGALYVKGDLISTFEWELDYEDSSYNAYNAVTDGGLYENFYYNFDSGLVDYYCYDGSYYWFEKD